MTPKPKKKMGRPPIPAADRRTEFYMVRMTPTERRTIETEAKNRGVSVAGLLMAPWRKERA